MDNNNKNNQNNNKNKKNVNGLLILVIWAVGLTVVFNYLSAYSRQANSAASTHEILYTELLDMVDAGQVERVLLVDGKLEITPVEGYVYTDEDGNAYDKNYTLFTVPIGAAIGDLIERVHANGGEFSYPYVPEMSPILEFMLAYILPLVLMIGGVMLFMNLMTRKGGGIGGIGSVGKANAKVYMEKSTGVTFNDVAGQDEAKESLVEIIDFLHNPGKYTAIGAKLPKGALLVGSPGTGKTLLAKAVAGEAGVPFFSISGSGFVEMFVGVGASRVRDLFQEAAKVAPCIIFIDEIDAIGKTRDSRFGGGNDEREQTLNQLLAEMDGFDPSKGIIVLAATNRPEVLDKALLRPGRFDRRITVDRPNLAGRLATLQVHTRKIRMAEDVDLNKIAQATAGCVGADLANTVNEAALRAVRHNRHAVNQEDLLASFEVVIAGAEKKGTVITEQEKKIIAYHEVGHALAAARQKNAQPVTKITIVPHTEGALGYTLHLPEEEKFLMSRDDILTEIRTLLAGRCAEELVFNTQTSGAANDIERATELARNLVARFGMSEKFGMMALGSVQSQYLDGGYSMNCAQETFALADKEVATLLQKCHDEARTLLEENREMLDKIAGYLFEKETITGAQMMAILEGRDPDKEDYYGVPAKSDEAIEPPAKHINIVSEPIPMPMAAGEEPEEKPEDDGEGQIQE
ncbi:MAG: ATP-dependent zinc metalloprotease FtsH [Oscillospiraceae bacterium]|jgi:cell division protease FtsH|nr:ATP-dependent zinc metalloprotease FtsH [Oscillospiraceae bacterium]